MKEQCYVNLPNLVAVSRPRPIRPLDPAAASASAPSSEVGGRARWTRVKRQRAKVSSRAGTSEAATKAVRVFTAAGKLDRSHRYVFFRSYGNVLYSKHSSKCEDCLLRDFLGVRSTHSSIIQRQSQAPVGGTLSTLCLKGLSRKNSTRL
jgi:hypothetical protein